MKIRTTCLLLICSFAVMSQQSLDTIYANNEKNVALFFPKPIRQGITGAAHFVFTYNREKEQYFGLLQAQPGSESNLLTVTSDGRVYSYIIQYAENLPQLNYFISPKASIGNEMPQLKPIGKKKSSRFDTDKMAYFQRACTTILNANHTVLASKRKDGLRLQLQQMVYDGTQVYLAIEIKNTSGINFEIDYLDIFRTNGNNQKKASYQSLKQEVIYTHEMPDVVLNNLSQRFVIVLPKFVLGDNEKLRFELKERGGSRRVVLETSL